MAATTDEAAGLALLTRCAEALERIAARLETFEAAEDAPCAHPESEREVSPTSTMGHVTSRCKVCGEEGM